MIDVFPGVVVSERKQAFLDHLAQSYDRYVDAYDVEPDAVAYVIGGVGQHVEPYWMIKGASENSCLHVLLTASVILGRS